MNSKFEPVLKVKKQKLDMIENKLAIARLEKRKLDNDLEKTKQDILNSEFPKKGTFATLQVAMSSYKILKEEKEQISEQISLKSTQISHLENQHKNAYMDMEKMKYLHDLEIKTKVEKLKKQESLALDEIATQRHFFLKGK